MLAYRVPLHYSCSIYACWPSVTAPLLFKHAYWLSFAAKLMLAGPLPLNQHACRSFATQSCMYADVVLLYMPYLLVWYLPCLPVWCLTIGHVIRCGVSLSAVLAGVVHSYRSCLLVWCLTISQACWCGASL